MSDIKQIEHTLLRVLLTPSDEADALVIVDSLKPKWFTCDATRAILEFIRESSTTDIATIVNACDGLAAFQAESAKTFVVSLIDSELGTIQNAGQYVEQVAEAYESRKREELGHAIVKHAHDRERCQQLLSTLEERVAAASIAQIAEGIHERLADRETGDSSEIVPCHLHDMNDRAPLRRGHVAVVAAQTGVGKTTYALNVAKHAAEEGHGALIISLEMRRAELCDRVLANQSRVALDEIQNFGTHTKSEQRQAILEATAHVESLPLHVVDAFESTPAGVAAQCRKHMRKHPFELLVVDYLQLLKPNHSSGNRAADVASCSRAMKNLANELDIAILLVSQFNRLAKDERPQLWHLKESSSIEQDASLILMLFQDRESKRDGEIDIIVRKQRHGEQNFVIKSLFLRETCRFVEAAPPRYDAYAEYETTGEPA